MTPKLSSLTPEDKIKMAAELDGWRVEQREAGLTPHYFKNGACYGHDYFQKHLTSYDAIIPLIQKQPALVKNNIIGCFPDEVEWFDETPLQLLDALLIATGKTEL